MTTPRQTIGFTLGTFDLFHVGHVNLLRNSKSLCDRLIVGIVDDETVCFNKGKPPVISLQDRMEIVRNIRYVDVVTAESVYMVGAELFRKYDFDIVFSGDDWIDDDRNRRSQSELENLGVRVIYFPYMRGVSSAEIRQSLLDRERRPE